MLILLVFLINCIPYIKLRFIAKSVFDCMFFFNNVNELFLVIMTTCGEYRSRTDDLLRARQAL